MASIDGESYEKGQRFEKVLQWWLQNDPYWRTVLKPHTVKLWQESELRDGVDIGIDLTAEGFDGRTWAIQAKNWKADNPIPKSEIDKFIVASNTSTYQRRVLVTSTNEISSNAERAISQQEKPLVVVKRDDLADSPIWDSFNLGQTNRGLIPLRKLRPHQEAALSDVVKSFQYHKRGQLIMACGSGKTLTALRIAEALKAQKILVLLPSLLLVRQTLNAWYSDAAENFASIAVCSDPTTAAVDRTDSIIELPFPTTTRPDDIQEFLDRKGRKVIFSTYDSSERVAEALPQGFVFDLIICDEAHRIAGLANSTYAACLDDSRLPSDRKLFMTATPRIFSETVKQKADDRSNLLYSMDDESIFGPVMHTYSFASAISDKMLTDYQVIVIGVDDAETAEMIDSRELLDVEGMVTDARELAVHVALAKTMDKYDLKRVITYHSRINKASSFANQHQSVLNAMERGGFNTRVVWTSWITGRDSTFKRQRQIRHLETLDEGHRGILSNARCLTEGVDVPSLDGIAFVDKRNSTVDIVQAVGRAIRLGPNKKMGYVVVPFLLQKGKPPSQIESSEWAPVWAVLNAMRAHDSRIGEEIDAYRENLGRGRVGNAISDRIVLDLPSGVPESFFREVNEILVSRTGESWWKNYGRLLRFVEEFATADVPSSYEDNEGALGDWVSVQRMTFDKGELSAQKISLLEDLPGWQWKKKFEWEEQFAALSAAHAQFSVEAFRTDFVYENSRNLGSWLATQRQRKKQGGLSADQIAALEGLEGWTWDAVTSIWWQRLEELTEVSTRLGTANIPAAYVTEKGTRLGNWVDSQRSSYKQGKLDQNKVEALESLTGFVWAPKDEAFQRGLEAMRRFWTKYPGELADRSYVDEEGYSLGNFLADQRRSYSDGQMSPIRKEQLDKFAGWESNTQDAQIENYRKALVEFGIREGHYKVPTKYISESGVWLGLIIQKLRKRKVNEMSKYWLELERALTSVQGFQVPLLVEKKEALQQNFEQRRLDYQNFVDQIGRQPSSNNASSEQEESLVGWVGTQRASYKRGELSEERVKSLEELDYWIWDNEKAQFLEKLGIYKEWIAEHGSLKVPDKASYMGINLGSWRSTLRASRKKGTLPKWKVEFLNELGDWES